MKTTAVSGSFDDLRAADLKFLKAAAETGRVILYLWPDEMHRSVFGAEPRFNMAERQYFAGALVYVDEVTTVEENLDQHWLPEDRGIDLWFVRREDDSLVKREYCLAHEIEYRLFEPDKTEPDPISRKADKPPSPGKKVIVTGCYDYFHTGHIRFFEEAAEYGDLYVVIGSDRNVEMLKGAGHPHYREEERLFMVQSIKYVKKAFISTGSGWMDAQPEIEKLHPDIYVVNEDGDKPEKREFCEKHNLQYLILRRAPKNGLPARTSTDLRGF